MAVKARSDKHIGILANAGTGKTTTVIQLVYRMLGINDSQLLMKGTKEQRAIWDAGLSGPRPEEIRIVAFGRRNKEDLEKKLKVETPKVKISTIHGFGMSVLMKCGHMKTNFKSWMKKDYKHRLICEDITGMKHGDIRSRHPQFLEFSSRIVGLVKSNVFAVETEDDALTVVEHLVTEHNIRHSRPNFDLLVQSLPVMMAMHKETIPKMIDFNDMVWGPIVLNCEPPSKFPLLIVDEAQDCNSGQRQLLLKSAERFVIVGDPCQAIMGFQGADVRSMPKFFKALSKRNRGLEQFGLTVCFRCPQVIIPLVKPLVPSFRVTKKNEQGSVVRMGWADMFDNPAALAATEPKATTCFIARRNAYNVAVAVKLIVRGTACTIIGREFGEDLIGLIEEIANGDTTISGVDMIPLIDEWRRKESAFVSARFDDAADKVVSIEDRAQCLVELCRKDPYANVQTMIHFVSSLFKEDSETPICLCSLHRAKGLEFDHVIFLAYNACPDPLVSPDSEMYQQEKNLLYVGVTRTKRKLFLVDLPVIEGMPLPPADTHELIINGKGVIQTIEHHRDVRTVEPEARSSTAQARVQSGSTVLNAEDKLTTNRLSELRDLILGLSPEQLQVISTEIANLTRAPF